MSVRDLPWRWVTEDGAVLIAKTFTVDPAPDVFHGAEASLIRMISGEGEHPVKGTCLTSFTGVSQKLSHKAFHY